MKMTQVNNNPHIGASFDDFLEKDGLLETCEDQAIKEILADQIKVAMEEDGPFDRRAPCPTGRPKRI